jgi:hypothetical protein
VNVAVELSYPAHVIQAPVVLSVRPALDALADAIECFVTHPESRNPLPKKIRIAWTCGRVQGHEHTTKEDAALCRGEVTPFLTSEDW